MKSPLSKVEIPDNVSFVDFLMERISSHGTKTALIDGVTGNKVSYTEVHHQAAHLATALWCQYKLTKGQVVCIFLPNSTEYVILVQAILLTGATLTTCNPAFKPGELRKQLEDSSTGLIITNNANLHTVSNASKAVTSVRDIILLDGDKNSSRYPSVSSLIKRSGKVSRPAVKLDPQVDIAMILYSSGTTGRPKGVMLTHYNLLASLQQFCHPVLEMGRPTDVFLAVTPMFHIYGLQVIVHCGLFAGVTLVTLPKFNPDDYLRCIDRYKVTFLHVTPPTALFLAQSPLVDKYNISSVHTVFSGAAPLPESVAVNVQRRFGADVRQGFGMTEASPGILHALPRTRPYTTVGVPLPNTEVKVQDIGTGKELPSNEVGEMLLRGPQVMKGYLGNLEATAQAVTNDGWLRTGDLGYYSEDGLFFIVDRLKELIKYKGFQVAPAELESVLLTHPSVGDAAVVGRTAGATGELPTAFVVTKNKVSVKDIQQYVAERVAPYKQLRGGVIFVDLIPKSPSGKILRRILKERLHLSHKL